MSEYSKSYWRVDAEYQTIQYVSNVSDEAPVGVWITTLGAPYAYFETEEAARTAFKSVLEYESERIKQLLISSREEYANGQHYSSAEMKEKLKDKFNKQSLERVFVKTDAVELLRELAAAEELYHLFLEANGPDWVSTIVAKQKLEEKGNTARVFLYSVEG